MYVIAHKSNSRQLMTTPTGGIINFLIEDEADTFLDKQENKASHYVRKAMPNDYARSGFRRGLKMYS